jgi:GNAT superfamily N-acetyltransferase
MDPTLTIRPGGPSDAGMVIGLFDEAIEWLVARGQTGQWGAKAFSAQPEAVARVHHLAGGGGLRVAQIAEEGVGALVVGEAPPYVRAAERPELYIQLLLASRRHAGERIGARLVAVAVDEAREAGCAVLRVDCWADAPALVDWYRGQGFDPTGTFEQHGWRGQILDMGIG